MGIQKGTRFSPYPQGVRWTVTKIRTQRVRPLPKTAIKLARLTGIPKDAWLHPEYVFNPEIPYVWKGEWKPPIDHLNGWGKRWAEMLLRDFPDKKPTQKQFFKWLQKRKFEDYRFIKNGGQI